MTEPQIETQWNELRGIRWGRGSATLWIVERYGPSTKVVYRVRSAGMGESLKGAFVDLFENATTEDVTLEDYSPVDTDQDERVFWARAEETDFTSIQEMIDQGSSADGLSSLEDLKYLWAVVVELKTGSNRALCFTKLRGDLSITKAGKLFNVFFNGVQFETIHKDKTVTLPKRIDFIVMDGTIFILDRKQFELGLNMREGLVQSKHALSKDLKRVGLFANPDDFAAIVGEKKRRLRRLALIRENGYYKKSGYVRALIRANTRNRWGLTVKKGKILIDPSTVDLLLKLLNNDRVASMINDEKFDAEIKRPIT